MRAILLVCAVGAAACSASESVPAQTATTSSTVAAPAPDVAPTSAVPDMATVTTATKAGPYAKAPTLRSTAAASAPASTYVAVATPPSLQTSTTVESPSLPAAHAELTRDDGHAGATALSQGKSTAELRITAAVRRAVVRDDTLSFGAKNVTILTNGTHVTLRGTVPSVYERDRVEVQARTADGVTAVDNQLEVK